MGYGYRRARRYDPHAEERRKREEAVRARVDRDKRRFARLMRLFKRVTISADEASAAWKLPSLRTFTLMVTSSGQHIDTVIRGNATRLYIQEPGGVGWNFYRLVPRHHVYRESESGSYDMRDMVRR